jgi:hypothetical protein
MGLRGKSVPDNGSNYESMTPQQKADAFDASHADPKGYAETHFPAGQSNGEKYEAAREQQAESRSRWSRK